MLVQVPTAEWHCNLCKERIALRESKHSSLTQFEGSSSIEKHRNKTEEEALLNHVIDRRIAAVSTTGRIKDKEKEKDRDAQNASSASLSAMEPGPDDVRYIGTPLTYFSTYFAPYSPLLGLPAPLKCPCGGHKFSHHVRIFWVHTVAPLNCFGDVCPVDL